MCLKTGMDPPVFEAFFLNLTLDSRVLNSERTGRYSFRGFRYNEEISFEDVFDFYNTHEKFPTENETHFLDVRI